MRTMNFWSSPLLPAPLPAGEGGTEVTDGNDLTQRAFVAARLVPGDVLPACTLLTGAISSWVQAYADDVIEVMAMRMPGITKKTPRT